MNNNHIIRAKFNKIVEKQNEIINLIKDIESELNNPIEYSPIFPKTEQKYKSYSYDSGMYSCATSTLGGESDNESYGNEYDIGLEIDEYENSFGDDKQNAIFSENLALSIGLPSLSKQNINHDGDKWVAPLKPGLQNSKPLI